MAVATVYRHREYLLARINRQVQLRGQVPLNVGEQVVQKRLVVVQNYYVVRIVDYILYPALVP